MTDEQLPNGYKGPLSGYYDRVSHFFTKKKLQLEQSMVKPVGIPRINRSRSKKRDTSLHSEKRLAQNMKTATFEYENAAPAFANQSNKMMILEDDNLLDESGREELKMLEHNRDLQCSQVVFSDDEHLPVEERLLKKGMEYKHNLN